MVVKSAGKQGRICFVGAQLAKCTAQRLMHLPSILNRRERLIPQPCTPSIPGVKPAPREIEQRHGAACARSAVDAHTERFPCIGKGMVRLMAACAGLRIIAGKTFLEKQPLSQRNPFDGQRVVGGQLRLRKMGRDREGIWCRVWRDRF